MFCQPEVVIINMRSNWNPKLLDQVRHVLNPLHVYCRLTSQGISSKAARKISQMYEICLYKPTLGDRT